MTDYERDPWTMQPDEDAKAFEAFTVYRDLPPRDRTIAKVAERIGLSVRRCEELSRTHGWVDRSNRHDAHLDEIEREKQVELILRMRDRHAELAEKALRIVGTSLDRRLEEIEANPTERLGDGNLLAFLTQTAQMERLARGEPTEIAAMIGGTQIVDVQWGDMEMDDDDIDDWDQPSAGESAETPPGAAEDTSQ